MCIIVTKLLSAKQNLLGLEVNPQASPKILARSAVRSGVPSGAWVGRRGAGATGRCRCQVALSLKRVSKVAWTCTIGRTIPRRKCSIIKEISIHHSTLMAKVLLEFSSSIPMLKGFFPFFFAFPFFLSFSSSSLIESVISARDSFFSRLFFPHIFNE